MSKDNLTHTATSTQSVEMDEALRRYMLRVYNIMAMGVAVTGIVVVFLASQPELLISLALSPLRWVFFLGVLGLGWFAPRLILQGTPAMAQTCYWSYAIGWGVLIAPMMTSFMQSTEGMMDIARAFFITTAMFAGASIFGYTTKRNLAPMGQFLMMATIGLLVAILVNAFFVQDSMFSMLISVAVVLVFAAVTAWETQIIKNMFYEGHSGIGRLAIMGAFMLYGSFITIFIHVLNILGMMRGE